MESSKMPTLPPKHTHRFRPTTACRYTNAAIAITLACYLFIIPFASIVYHLDDPALQGDGIPKFAFTLHRSLAPKFEKWAIQRVESAQACDLSIHQIAETEWPVFGSLFYLLATDALQQA